MENLVRANRLKENIPVSLKIGVLLQIKIWAAEMIIYFQQDVILPQRPEDAV